MKKNVFYSIILPLSLYSSLLLGQGGKITITGVNPTNFGICGEPKTFQVTLMNVSASAVTNPYLTVVLPTGVQYVAGTVTNSTEYDISDLDSIILDLNDISVGASVTVTFQAIATCSAISLIENDIDIQNKYRVDYDGNYDQALGAVYDLYKPSLVFQSISNQSYNGLVGQTFTRNIVIKNTGDYRLSGFTLDDVHGAGIQINSFSPGTFSNMGLTAKVVVSATEFSTVGNNDNYLDPSEQITIVQSVTILQCTQLSSNFKVYWGCGMASCDTTLQNGNVIIQSGVPNITYSATPSNNVCYGGSNISTQILKVANTGTEPARNVTIYVYQGTVAGEINNYYSRIDTSSIEYKIGNNGTYQNIDPVSVVNNTNYTCFASSDAIARFTIILPYIQPGDTVFFRWNVYTCCFSTCNGGQSLNGWCFKLSYQNQCLTNNYQTANLLGRGYNSNYFNSQTISGPSDVSNGQTVNFNVVNSGIGLYPGNTADDRIIVRLVLPAGLTWGGNLDLLSSNLTAFPVISTYISTSGDTIIRTFNFSMNLEKSEINFNVVGACGTAGNKNIQLTTIYQPTSACACNFDMRCTTIPIKLHCPSMCTAGGIDPLQFDMKRYNYGLPDNNNDGVADGMGSLDFTKVKVYQVMTGDTLIGTQKGVVRAGTSGATWPYVYVRNYVPKGGTNRSDIQAVTATATIYDASTGITYNVPNVPTTRTVSNPNCTFQHDLSAPTLIGMGILPPTFVYEDGDSISITYLYRLTQNTVDGNLDNISVKDTFFASQVSNPTLAQRYFCDTYGANFTIVGHYFTTWGPDSYTASGCSNVTITQNYYYSVGPCCTNYAGGNIFPFEYRSGSHLREIKVLLPTGYTFISARVRETRTAGTSSTITSPWITITPVNPTANPLIFNTSNLYTINGGTLPLSDDGYYGTYEITLRGSCEVTGGVNQGIIYTTKHEKINHLVGTVGSDSVVSNPSSSGDYILYQKPAFDIQSALPTVTATLDSVYWDVVVTNITSIQANNTWLYPQSLDSKINVYRIIDLGTMTDVSLVGGLYQLNNYPGGQIKTYRVYAHYTACSTDSIILHLGWNCSGYPTDLASYLCQTSKLTLKLTPVKPTSSIAVTVPPGPQNLCDTLDFEITVTNTSAGHGYEPRIFIKRPGGMFIVSGSAQIQYPNGGSYVSIPNPKVFGSYYVWKLDTVDVNLNAANGGLKGAPLSPNNSYKLRFKMYTTCSYVSGSYLRIISSLKGGCGSYTNNYFNSPIVTIAGAPNNYTTSISVIADTIKTCNATIVKLKVINNGPGTTNATDEIRVDIPNGISYVAGSTVNIHNGPTGEPTLVSLGAGDYEARWTIPASIVPGDSIVFTYQVVGDPGTVSGNYDMNPRSVIQATLACGASTCNIFATSGSLTKDYVVDRPNGVWLGTVDTDWFNPANWSDCEIPNCAKDVQITNVPNQPVINTSATAATQTLLLDPSTTLTMNANATLHICGDLDVSNMANFVSGSNAEVHFTGASTQTVNINGTANFEKVVINQSVTSNVVINQDFTINQSLILTNGVIVTGVNLVDVINGAPTAVNAGNMNSYVNGYLRRNVNANGTYYLPVGNTAKGYQLAEIFFTDRGGVNQLYSYFNNWAGPLPVEGSSECGVVYNCNALNHGYWTINANNPGMSPTYDIYLHNQNYTNPCVGQTVMKSPTGMGMWAVSDGVCDPASTASLTIRRNLHAFSDFAVAQSLLPLPVELIQFKATPYAKSIQLTWVTLTENNNFGFEVLRSTDGKTFQKIGWVAAIGNQGPNHYEFLDENVQINQKYYYQLKQVDVDGRYRMSNIAEAIISENTNLFTIYPNPNQGKMQIIFENLTQGNVNIQFLNALGQVVWIQNKNLPAGLQTINLETRLSTGVYTILINTTEKVYQQKVIIE